MFVIEFATAPTEDAAGAAGGGGQPAGGGAGGQPPAGTSDPDAAAAAASEQDAGGAGEGGGAGAGEGGKQTPEPITVDAEARKLITTLSAQLVTSGNQLKASRDREAAQQRSIDALETQAGKRSQAPPAGDGGGDGGGQQQPPGQAPPAVKGGDVLDGYERDDDGHVLIDGAAVPETVARTMLQTRAMVIEDRRTRLGEDLADMQADFDEVLTGLETTSVGTLAGMVDRRFGQDLSADQKQALVSIMEPQLKGEFSALREARASLELMEHFARPDVAIGMAHDTFKSVIEGLSVLGPLQAAANAAAARDQPLGTGGVAAQSAPKKYTELSEEQKRADGAARMARIREREGIPTG